jgi:hypothetical protein
MKDILVTTQVMISSERKDQCDQPREFGSVVGVPNQRRNSSHQISSTHPQRQGKRHRKKQGLVGKAEKR